METEVNIKMKCCLRFVVYWLLTTILSTSLSTKTTFSVLKDRKKLHHSLTLFRMGLFGAFSHISYNDKTWHSYTLPKEDPKTL